MQPARTVEVRAAGGSGAARPPRSRAPNRNVAPLLVFAIAAGAYGVRAVQRASRGAHAAVIARSGIHWHSVLTVSIRGEPVEIPRNVGIGVVGASIHTHEDLPKLHLEIAGVVTEEDIRLGRFFAHSLRAHQVS